MNWQTLLDPAIQTFIRDHENADPAQLALNKNLPEPRALILDQIKARQKARRKMPDWLEIPNLILPAASIMEQASSTATAIYKASLITGKTFIDLTGGSGIDSLAFARHFTSGHIIERDPECAARLQHNAKQFGFPHITIHTGNAEDILLSLPKADLITIDPERRNAARHGIYKLEDCSPNITSLLPLLAQKADRVMIKTSPMLDIDQGITLLKYVSDVHAVEWQSECKELLFILKPRETQQTPTIHAITLNNDGTPKHHLTQTTESTLAYSNPLIYLHEPGPAIQKAGLHATLASTFPIQKIAPDTNLFTSKAPIDNFPGRSFKIIACLPPHKKAVPMKKANLTIRNFPDTVENLRKKLNLKDGGNDYLFACTLKDGTKTLIHTHKTTQNLSQYSTVDGHYAQF